MSVEPKPKPKSYFRRSLEFEASGEVSEQDWEWTQKHFAALVEGMARKGLEEGWLVEVDTPDGSQIVPAQTPGELATAGSGARTTARERG